MTLRSLLFFSLFISITSTGFAQLQPIQTDRPDQTECPFIVPKGFIQLECGFLAETIDNNNQSFTYPSILWKYGVNENFEFRLITELASAKSFNQTISGLMPITVGFKAKLTKEKGIIPAMAFIGHMTTSNLGTKDYHTTHAAPSFRFNMQHTLSSKFSLSYNLGAEWDGETANPNYLYTLTTGMALTEKLGCYIELYGFLHPHQHADHRFDGGLTYLFSNHLMVDLSGGAGITTNAPDYYLAAGISYRFKVNK